jgi:hypothetical protein
MPFGKYGPKQGDCRKMRDVPARYLLYLWDEGIWQESGPVHDYIEKNFSALESDAPDYDASTHRPPKRYERS